MRYEKHHLLWTRAEWASTPLSKRVRAMSAYIIDVSYINHRLIHAMMQPPDVPSRKVLLEMEELAVSGISEVQRRIEHPITRHIGRQLIIAALDENVAHRLLDEASYNRYNNKGEPI